MNCNEISQLLGAYLDGELEETLRPEVEKHLGDCPDCRKEADAIADFSSLVRTTLPTYEAPSKLKAKIRASLRKECAGLPFIAAWNSLSLILTWPSLLPSSSSYRNRFSIVSRLQ